MVSYLTKSDASEGFTQVIDFLNRSYIKYALTINPDIYVSCIKKFWNTVVIKQVNDVTRLQAPVDKKKVVIKEAAIRESLSAKRTSWNEFSSAMASAVICLSTGDFSTHTTKYTSAALTQKVFANMRRVGKEFSGVETPLFEGMIVGQMIKEGGAEEEHVEDVTAAQRDDTTAHRDDAQEPSIPSPTLPTPPPQPPQDLSSTSQLKRRVKKLEKENKVKVLKLQRLKKVGTSQRIDRSKDTVMDDASNQERIIDDLDKDDVVALMDDKDEDKKEEEAKEVVDVVTTAKLITEVFTAASETVTAASAIISAAEPQVTAATITDALSKDKGKGIIVEEPKPLKKKQQVEMDEEYARKLHAELNKDIEWDVAIDHTKEQMEEEEEESRAL
uniref:Xylulose kinase-1 n=1 Tax=Tanacetum cinerariifolium TaxID=118510 RepID=A0A6L2L5M3_TANCI|nr:hypothetical protein [Tanacetum cinerariifolium]